MTVMDLRELLVNELHDLYSAEMQITEALPKMIEMATEAKLVEALSNHLEQTKEQVERLAEVHEILEVTHDESITCKGIQGIIKENEMTLAKIEDTHTKDVAIIAGAQKVEHYEIASYGSAVQFAKELELDDAADLLEKTLGEEKEADALLTKIATGGLFSEGVNEKAADNTFQDTTDEMDEDDEML